MHDEPGILVHMVIVQREGIHRMKTIDSLFNLPRRFFENAELDTGATGPTPATPTELTNVETNEAREELQGSAR
jgi:hypothetical protein